MTITIADLPEVAASASVRLRDELLAILGGDLVGARRSFSNAPDGIRPPPTSSASRYVVWVDDKFYFVSGPGTRKSQNLAERADCALAVALPGLDLTFEGTATRVIDEPTLQRLAGLFVAQGWSVAVKEGAFTTRYSTPSAGPLPWDVYEFTLMTAFGLASAEPHGATRWNF